MTHRILITPDGDAVEGIALEADMHWTDNLPSHVIPCPERDGRHEVQMEFMKGGDA